MGCCLLCPCLECLCCLCHYGFCARIMYALMLIATGMLATITLIPGLESIINSISDCSLCKRLTGYPAVYRFCFSTTIFFLVMSLIMIGVRNSKDRRSHLQNGFWCLKFLILIIFWIAALFIPIGSFDSILLVVGMIGGVLFIVIQIVFCVTFVNILGAQLLDKSFCFIATLTIGAFGISITGGTLLYVYFGSEGWNLFVITLNLILCVGSCVVSVLPAVQNKSPSCGLFQSSLICCYVVYLTWISLSTGHQRDEKYLTEEKITSVLVWMVIMALGTLNFGSKKSHDLGLSSRTIQNPNEKNQTNVNDEINAVRYNWSFFHFIFALACLNIMMVLTNWYEKESTSLHTFQHNTASMWVNLSSSWFCLFIYNWMNLAPLACPQRDFS